MEEWWNGGEAEDPQCTCPLPSSPSFAGMARFAVCGIISCVIGIGDRVRGAASRALPGPESGETVQCGECVDILKMEE